MTAGILRAVVEHAIAEAEEHEAEAEKKETEAREHRKLAEALRALHAVAEPHVIRPGQVSGQ